MGFFDSLVQTPVTHLQSAGDTYSKNPEQALLGINTPAEAYVWNSAIGTHYKPTTNMFGGPSESAYALGAKQGNDMSAGRFADSVAPAVVGGVASAFGGPMAGMAAAKGTSAVNQMGAGYERNLNSQYGFDSFKPNEYKGYAKGGLTAIDKMQKTDKTSQVLANYFRNRGIPLEAGMQGVQKEVAEGLKLVPYESSVMGFKPLGEDMGQVHFFTIGTMKDLADDMKYFVKQLKGNGIKVIYDRSPAPITTSVLQKMGATVEKSDNPKFPFKATL